ncbi:MAG: tetratricopeptide repeat protein [Anaerolineales bacterium]|nr:tetratricopeptide repeat protein [Anaerolineales bacterium]
MAKNKSKPTYRPASPDHRLIEGLEDTDRLMRQQQWAQARQLLEDLNRRFRNQPQVLARLMDVTLEEGDSLGYLSACERMQRLEPGDPDLVLALIGAYVSNQRPSQALRWLGEFLERWPKHPQAEEARRTQANILKDLAKSFAGSDLAQGEWLQLAAQLDELRAHLNEKHYRQATAIGENLVQRFPRTSAAHNHLAQAAWLEGQWKRAIAVTQQVLEFEPGNLYAVRNLAQFLTGDNQTDTAAKLAHQLKQVALTTWEECLLINEALSYLGDDAGVLQTFEHTRQWEDPETPGVSMAMIYHLAAAATCRLGNESDARQLWKKSIDRHPGFSLAQDNLEDLGKPVGEKNAPWPFSLKHWLPERLISEFLRTIELQQRGSQAAMGRACLRLVKRHPELENLAPRLLERGDGFCREFVLALARQAQTPVLLQAAHDFALGRYGPDQMRLEAAYLAIDNGLLPSGFHRLWLNGQWTEILLLGIKLHHEQLYRHSQTVQRQMEQALMAARQGEIMQAEKLLTQALETEPDSPDILYNQSALYQSQARYDQAYQLIEDIYTRYPEYLFGRVGKAQILYRKGEFEQARQVLEPLFSRKSMNHSEFDAFCAVNIELFLAEENIAKAAAWFNTWESANPQNPKLEIYRDRITPPNLDKSSRPRI